MDPSSLCTRRNAAGRGVLSGHKHNRLPARWERRSEAKGEAMSEDAGQVRARRAGHPDPLGQPDGGLTDPADPAPPPLHPGTKEPAGPDDLSPIFPMALILQEVSAEPEIEIPEPVREAYKLWRPTPLFRARRLERELDTPAHIYYKYEGGSPRRLAQAEHRGRPGLRERPGRHQEADHRDRRRPVGLGSGLRLPPVRPRVRGVDGRLELRPEALPALDDGDLGRHRPPLARRT